MPALKTIRELHSPNLILRIPRILGKHVIPSVAYFIGEWAIIAHFFCALLFNHFSNIDWIRWLYIQVTYVLILLVLFQSEHGYSLDRQKKEVSKKPVDAMEKTLI